MAQRTRREFLTDSLLTTAAAAAVPLVPSAEFAATPRKVGPNDLLRVGVVGVRGRGRGHTNEYRKSKDTEVVAICDADSAVIGGAMKAAPKAKYYQDIRKMLEDDSIDIISIASPNHWHSLMAIWAIQAGKHVYVEKPLSHNVHEGRALVKAARRYDKIVQHGTQARTHKATIEALEWLRSGGLGECNLAIGLCYKRRGSIGKVEGPQQPPETCDYELWTGPAEKLPLTRKKLHYDWHWDYNTGNGDMGNQGVHQMDIARWGLGLDGLPNGVASVGARLGYDDDGNTANTQICLFDYGPKRILFETRGLPTKPYEGAKIGVVFHCEDGYLVSASYGKVHAYDKDGKEVKVFKGGGNHFQNFIDAVKAGSNETLNAECEDGHKSSAMCHLGNISHFLGEDRTLDATDTPFEGEEAANESFRRFRDHLVENGIDAKTTNYTAGPRLTFEPDNELFVGDHAKRANELKTRKYRKGFVVPSQP